jgi:transcriptional regulator with XRE-family HTH domain
VQKSHTHYFKFLYALSGLSHHFRCLTQKDFLVMSEKEGDRTSKKRLNLCGPHLRRLRLEQHLTLVDIQATLELDYGIALDRTNLGRIENGERTVTDIELVVLAHLLGVSLEQLLWGEIPPDAGRIGTALKNVEVRYAARRFDPKEKA